jgi:hypothetical protein
LPAGTRGWSGLYFASQFFEPIQIFWFGSSQRAASGRIHTAAFGFIQRRR